MIAVLVDHDTEGQAARLWTTFATEGWLDLNLFYLVTFRDEGQATSLPVVTIGNLNRMVERSYREACATRLAEIAMYLDNYLGTGRQFIP